MESKGKGLRSIIYYVITRKVLRPGVIHVKVVRRAEAASDHYLGLMKLNLKLRKPNNPEEAIKPKLRVRRLEEREVRWRFHLELVARYRWRRCKEEDGVEEVWQCFKENVMDAAYKVARISRRKRQ